MCDNCCVLSVVGLKTPDTAQYEGLKLLCSLVMMLLGNGFYGAPGPNTDTRFVDQGTKSSHQCEKKNY